MEYLTLHETTAAYEAVKDSLELPHVALTLDDNVVHYQPLVAPSHEYVDLGLPSGTKWATMNVGATSVTDYGNYYQYGKGADTYQVTSGQSKYSGTEDPLAASADTAVQEWGGEWHMPTKTQFEELTANTTYAWATNYQGSGVNGATFTANEQTLFIPAAGFYGDGSLHYVGDEGNIWSSTPSDSLSAYKLHFRSGNEYVVGNGRSIGFSVRPVLG